MFGIGLGFMLAAMVWAGYCGVTDIPYEGVPPTAFWVLVAFGVAFLIGGLGEEW